MTAAYGLAQHDGRRAARDAVSFRTRLRRVPTGAIDIHMVDLSPLGFMARTSAALATDETVEIELPALGHCRARVVWSLGGRIGGEFSTPIPPDRYAKVLASAPAAPPPWRGF